MPPSCPCWCSPNECEPPAAGCGGAPDMVTLHRRRLAVVGRTAVEVVQVTDSEGADEPLLWLGGEEVTAAELAALWPHLVEARRLLGVGE